MDIWKIVMFLPFMLMKKIWAHKVLFIPAPVGSHMILLSSLAEAWVAAGHEAHVIKPYSVPIPSQFKNSGIKYVNYGKKDEIHFTMTDEFTRAVLSFNDNGFLYTFKFYNQFFDDLCQELLQDETLYDELDSHRYDFAIVDEFPSRICYQAIPHRLGVPHGLHSAAPLFDVWGLTLQLNYVLPPFRADSNEPSFVERFLNFIIVQSILLAKNFKDNEIIHNYLKNRTVESVIALKNSAKIWFVVQEPLMHSPMHASPNLLFIGSISSGPAKPLPNDLQTFADSAQEGLIVVSFGGSLIADFPIITLKQLLAGLGAVKQKVIIRLKTKPDFEISENILTTSWLPQNDLLGHKNTVLFITHCGLSSVIEALYHGVPVLGFPIQMEQKLNCKRFMDKHYGLVMDRKAFTADELKITIEKMITNSTWKDTISKASKIIKSRPYTSGQEAAHLIEAVIQFGADHLTPSTVHLAWYQIILLDVMAAILIIVVVTVFIVIKCFQCIKRRVCCKRKKIKAT